MTYVAYPEGTLWRSKIDGTERLQLTFPPMFVFMPRWSPDATRIAFTGQEQPGRASDVYLISAEGGSPERVLPEGRGTADPTWSPDGNSLLFGRYRSDAPWDVGTQDLAILDLRTHANSAVPGSRSFWWARWSPDGRHIIAVPPAGERLMLFDLKSQEVDRASENRGGLPGVVSQRGLRLLYRHSAGRRE